jgi:hypothetical protein
LSHIAKRKNVKEFLLNRSSNAARTSQLLISISGVELRGEVVVHPDVASDEYQFVESFEIDATEAAVRRLIGSTVLVFNGVHSGATLFVYGQTGWFKVLSRSVGVPVSLFDRLVEQSRSGRVPLRIRNVLMRLGSKAVENRSLQPVARDLTAYWSRSAVRRPVTRTVQAASPVRQTSQPRPSHVSRAPSYGTYGRFSYSRDAVSDDLFLAMYPGVTPVYRPGSMLAWYLWFSAMNYMPGQYFYDAYAMDEWAFVPGFPGAVSQLIVPFGDGYRVEMLDAGGNIMANFTLSGYAEQMQLVTCDGDVFSVVNAAQPYIRYVDDGQAFCWNGVDMPFTGSSIDVDIAVANAGALYVPGPMDSYAPLDDNPGFVAPGPFEMAAPVYPEPVDAGFAPVPQYVDPDPFYSSELPQGQGYAGAQYEAPPQPQYEEPATYQQPQPETWDTPAPVDEPAPYVQPEPVASYDSPDVAYSDPVTVDSFSGSGGGDNWGD